MRFTETEIQTAARLRGAGLMWTPRAGHYVFDIDGIVRAPSPFQAGVHLISSANAMEQLAGGAEDLHQKFAWLPTWDDAREWFAERAVPRQAVIAALQNADEHDLTDRMAVYGLILDTLERAADERA
jgi:hypothetical protein